MKKYFLLLYFSLFITTIGAQNSQPAASKTYALVVGISGYQDASIPKLNYADKDANLFAQWLQSKAGGSVPGYNIKLLTNQDASIAAVYAALNWLQDIAGRNDIVYMYFSGHGDMEIDSASISKGYLLAYNSPPNNYSNNAVSINDLNNTANILTINNGAKVILITDACHSGKLAGDVFK
ncbi:MAG: caspase family protein, partial [Ferruginibacter sp.]|nr:caspase family protein [Ferruginibacter sp.]